MSNIQKLDALLTKYYDTLESGNKKKQEIIYNEYLELKHEIKLSIDSLSKTDKNFFKTICSEFRILSNEEERNKLFHGIKKSQLKSKKFNSNDDYLKESKTISSNTTDTLRKSLQELKEAENIGNEVIVQINIDNDKINNVNQNLDQIQSDGY